MAKELAKQYDPKNVEDRIYDYWLKGNYFHAKNEPIRAFPIPIQTEATPNFQPN